MRLVLFSQALIGFTIFVGVYTVLLNLYLLRLGSNPLLIGQISAVRALSFALFSMPAGLLGDRWGSRLTMIVGMLLSHQVLAYYRWASSCRPLRTRLIL